MLVGPTTPETFRVVLLRVGFGNTVIAGLGVVFTACSNALLDAVALEMDTASRSMIAVGGTVAIWLLG